LLEAEGVAFTYREYTEEPLEQVEIRTLLKKLGLKAGEVFRKQDAVNRDLKLTGKESDAVLVREMARHPTLLQRPIGVLGEKAVLGRPVDELLSLVKP